MNAIRARWTNGRILPGEPVDWPEGSELLVEPLETKTEKFGLDDAEWRDDADALADWDAWLRTIEPVVLTDDERRRFAAFEQQMRQHNLDVMRKQLAAEEFQ